MAQEEDGERGTEKTHLEGGGKPASSSKKSSEPLFVLLDSRSSDPVLSLPSRECKCCESAWEPVSEQGLGLTGLVLRSFPPQPFPPLQLRLLSPIHFSLCCLCSSTWKPERACLCSRAVLPGHTEAPAPEHPSRALWRGCSLGLTACSICILSPFFGASP